MKSTLRFFVLLILASVSFKQAAQAQTKTKEKVKEADSVTNLKEVKISRSGNMIDRRIDRIVFNAEKSTAAVGTDALELLGKIPGVKVMNDKVSLVGKGSVGVMVNDRLIQLSEGDLVNYLKSISAQNISKVEIITNPPSKYDAQGNNGLINIILKKPVGDGLQGSISMDHMFARHYTGAVGAGLNYKTGKLAIISTFNFRKGSLEPYEKSNILYPTQSWNIVNQFQNFRTVPSGQLGIDYQTSKKTSFGISYNAGQTNFRSNENIRTSIYNSSGKMDSLLVSDANAKIKSNFNAANFFFKHVIDSTGKQFLINADWFKYKDQRERFFNNNTYLANGDFNVDSYAQYLSASKQNIDLYTIKADVDLPNKYFKLSMGTKLSFIRNKSDVSFFQARNNDYILDKNQSNVFDYTENTQAIYLNLNKSLKKWTIQLGLRAESTQTKGRSIASDQDDEQSYIQFFPTTYLTFAASSEHNFAFSFGRRINRPAYKKLNPFRWYSNQYAYMEGNPFLKPSYNDNFELSHAYAGIFATALSFSHTSNGYSDVNFTDQQSNVQILRPTNFISSYNYQLSNSITLNATTRLQSNGQLSVFYNRSNSSLLETANYLKGAGAYFSTSNQLYLNKEKTISGALDFWYQLGGIEGLQKMERQYSLDLGLKTSLPAKHLQVALTVTDLLKSNIYKYSSTVNHILQTYSNYYDSRQLKISMRYSFGNDQVKQQFRKTGNEEERKRSN